MSKKARLIALFMVLLMVGALFAGCGSTDEPAATTAATGGTTAAPGTTAPVGSDPATEPATEATQAPFDAEGYVFLWGSVKGFDPASSPGTSMAAELKAKYAKIEKDLNCKIEFVGGYDDTEAIMTSVTAGQKVVDFVRLRQYVWIPLCVNGALHELDDQKFVDAGLELNNEDVFFQHYTHLADFDGHTWGVDMSGKYSQMAFGHTYAFNKRLCEEAGYPADMLYQKVYDMEWTYEYFLEVAKAIQDDTNTEEVIWGVALDCDGNEIWTNGTGPIIFKDGKWVENIKAANVMAALEFMADINDGGRLSPPLYSVDGSQTAGRGDRRTLFYTGKAGFAGLYGPNFGYDGATNGTANMDDPAGLLPIPKGPEATIYQMNFVDSDSYCLPVSTAEYEKSARIMAAIGRAVHDIDEYYDFLYFESMLEDDDAYKILTEYLIPNGLMNIAKCTRDMYEITRKQFYSDVYDGQKSPQQAAEFYAPIIQAELDKVFKQ